MGRPKEFDVDEAVDAAMHAFWERGYEATSTQDLCDATGICRSSIYHTFGSKRELFERSLVRYTETQTATLIEILHRDDPVRDRVRDVLTTALASEEGCFAVNAVVELGGRDDDLTACARKGFDELRGELRCAIEAGQAAGEINRNADAGALADFVRATIGGLQVMSRSGTERAAMDDVITVAMAAL